MESNGTAALLGQYEDSTWISYLRASNWTSAICGIVALSIATRLFSGYLSPPETVEDGVKTVPLVPYWFPIIGHLPYLGFGSKGFFEWARITYKGGAFALNLGGTTHNFVFHPSLGTALINQRNGAADSYRVFKHIMGAVFAYPRKEQAKYDAGFEELSACYQHLLSEPSLGKLVQKTIDVLKENISNLVTFSPSIVDQNLWERTTGVDVVETNGEHVVEASLL